MHTKRIFHPLIFKLKVAAVSWWRIMVRDAAALAAEGVKQKDATVTGDGAPGT